MTHPDDESLLSRALAEWRVEPPRDPQFRAKVWSQIEAEPRDPSWPEYVRGRALWVAGAMVLAATVGALTGSSRARSQANADRTALAAEYVHALDPRWMRSP